MLSLPFVFLHNILLSVLHLLEKKVLGKTIYTCHLHFFLILSLPAHHSLDTDLPKVLVTRADDQIHILSPVTTLPDLSGHLHD